MWKKVKSLGRSSHDDTAPRRHSEDTQPVDAGTHPMSLSNGAFNESNTSIASAASSSLRIHPRNMFRRSKMPTEFTMATPWAPTTSSTASSSAMSPQPSTSSTSPQTIEPPATSSNQPLAAVARETSTPSPSPTPLVNPSIAGAQGLFKTPSGSSSVRSILRDRSAPGTGRSVRWNGKNSTRIITPDVSQASSSPASGSLGSRSNSMSEGSSADTVRTSLLSRFEDESADDDEDDHGHQSGDPRSRSVSLPGNIALGGTTNRASVATIIPGRLAMGMTSSTDLLDADPFASHTPPPSERAMSPSQRSFPGHRRTESSSSALSAFSTSAATFTLELDDPPSAMSNLLDGDSDMDMHMQMQNTSTSITLNGDNNALDMSEEPSAIVASLNSTTTTNESFGLAAPLLAQFPTSPENPSHSRTYNPFDPSSTPSTSTYTATPRIRSPPSSFPANNNNNSADGDRPVSIISSLQLRGGRPMSTATVDFDTPTPRVSMFHPNQEADDPISAKLARSTSRASAVSPKSPVLMQALSRFAESTSSGRGRMDAEDDGPFESQSQARSSSPAQSFRSVSNSGAPSAFSPRANGSGSGQHSRMPSEAPTIRPAGRQSPLKVNDDAGMGERTMDTLPSTPDASVYHTMGDTPGKEDGTVYHTPMNEGTRDMAPHQQSQPQPQSRSQSPATGTFFSMFSNSASRLRGSGGSGGSAGSRGSGGSQSSSATLAQRGGEDDGYIPPFLLPTPDYTPDHSYPLSASPVTDADKSADPALTNPAFNVPDNSLAFPAGHLSFASLSSKHDLRRKSTDESFIIEQLQQKLELYESLSSQYEADLSARDELVDELSQRVSRADSEVQAWRTEAERTTRKFDKMRGRVQGLAERCEMLTSQREQNSIFDQASGVALQQLHARCSSLDASKAQLERTLSELQRERDAFRVRAEDAERERDEAGKRARMWQDESERWQERASEFERESEAMVEQLNSLGDVSFSNASFSSRNSRASAFFAGGQQARSRPASMSVMSIEEIVQSASLAQRLDEAKTPTAADAQFSSSPVKDFLSPDDAAEAVYVLKSEILKREESYAALREAHATLEFTSTEARVHLETKCAELSEQLSTAQEECTTLRAQLEEKDGQVVSLKEHNVLKEELEAQWKAMERAQEEITTLEEEKEDAETKRVLEIGQSNQAMRIAEGEKEVLAAELQSALEKVEQLERARGEALEQLDAERGTLAASNDELKAAEHAIAQLNAQLHDQRELEAHIADLEAQLANAPALARGNEDLAHANEELSLVRDELARAKEEWVVREKALRDAAHDQEERLRQMEWNREQTIAELDKERQSMDELVLAHSNLEKAAAEKSQQLTAVKENESRLQSQVQQLQRQVAKATDAVEERERQCQALEQLSDEATRSLEVASSREAVACQERDAAVAERKAAAAALEEAQADLAERATELDNANTQLRNVKRQNADLEMTRMQLVKSQKQLEDDNAGLYIGLEAKQQELELVKRKFGVRGTAGATPVQGSSSRTPAPDSVFKVPHARRSSVSSSVADDDMTGPISTRTVPSSIAGRVPHKALKPRVSIATPTPAAQAQPLTRYPSLSHNRKTSSSTTLSSVASAQAGAVPNRPPGLRRPESVSDAESVSSATPAPIAKRTVRPLPSKTSPAASNASNPSASGIAPPTSFKGRVSAAASANGASDATLARSSSRTSISKRVSLQSVGSSPLDATPEEAEKENRFVSPPSNDPQATPKPSSTQARRRVMLPAA